MYNTEIKMLEIVLNKVNKNFGNKQLLKNVSFDEGITKIPENLFSECTGLESIIVDSGNSVYRSESNCIIKGNELILHKLDTEHGDVIIKGNINSIEYTTSHKKSESFLTRLFNSIVLSTLVKYSGFNELSTASKMH